MVSAASKKYHRNFIIFSNEDSGYEEGKKPSGHLLLEVRDRRERLSAVIQNLRNGNGRFGYALYLVRTHEGAAEYVRAGEISHSGGKAMLELVFEKGHIDGTVYSVNDFDTFAVLVETENRAGVSVTCPLVAYRNGRTDWRSGLRKALQKKFEADQMQMVNPNNQIYEPAHDTAAGYAQIPDKQPNYIFQYEGYYQPEQKAEYPPQFEYSDQFELEYGAWPMPGAEPAAEVENQPGPVEAGSEAENNLQPELVEIGNEAENNVQPELVEAGSEAEMEVQPETAEAGSEVEVNAQMEPLKAGNEAEADDQDGIADYTDVNAIQPETAYNIEQTYQDESAVKPQIEQENSCAKTAAQSSDNDAEKYKQQVQQPPGTEYKYPGSTGNINTECVYLNGNICGAVLNNTNTSGPCGSCRINRREAPSPMEVQAEGNLNGLEEELDKSFDICDPFHSRRSDYIWWRVTNPVNLNNIFYQNNIRSPLMFNPAVMMAHYKYKHLIIGVFTHKTGQRYIICGVPGMYMVDSKPFGEMSKWVQAEGNRQRYGAFGYWLLYINPKDGRIINF